MAYNPDRNETVTRAITRLVSCGTPREEILEGLVRTVEDLSASGMIASILILSDDGRHLKHGAAPSLPDEYNEAIDGLEIGPDVGSCGAAAFRGETVAVNDIATNSLWSKFKDLALSHGLRACWSTPIHGSDGKLLGTFANYYRTVRDPSPADLELTRLITNTAAMIIEGSGRTAEVPN